MSRPKRVGELEQLALLAVWRLEVACGGEVRDELATRADRDLTLGAVYLTLVRLENKGHLESTLGEPRPVAGGKARRRFRITEQGIEALHAIRERMNRMWEGLEAAPGS